MKNYPPEFKADAVALYESRPDATIRSVAADLGINPETLRNWVRAAGASRPRGRRTQEPAQPRPRWKRRTQLCGRRSASWRKNARSSAKRRSISPGRRAGEEP
ncbi:transposase [Streptomyces laculatispora]|uniref:transposase n=1 Tax=Streptomyces laculatispora TaxID=887464 RepID=UPI001A94EDEF|nr:transposase [Streptomyces laculatispora]MBO0913294.1 transposase [Streptomyces laculatispora]